MFSVSESHLTTLPESLGQLANLKILDISLNQLTALPESIGLLLNLIMLNLSHNQLTALPLSLRNLEKLGKYVLLNSNPLNPTLQSAYEGGLENLKAYLESLAKPAQVVIAI